MHHIQGCDRNQTLLLPNSVDDYIGPDNPIRFVDAFVGQLDMQGAGFFRVEPNETGRPGYHPADLLKLYIYGYLNRVRSSITLLSIFLLIGCGFRKLTGHGVECQAMAAKY